MKKLFYLGLTAILAAFTFTACGGGETTPGAAAKKYTQYMIDGKYDAFVDAIAFDEDETPEKIEQGKVMFKALLSEKVEKEFAKKGGVTNIEVISETISEDGLSATVELKYTYGDETTEDETMKLVKRDNKWLMANDK